MTSTQDGTKLYPEGSSTMATTREKKTRKTKSNLAENSEI